MFPTSATEAPASRIMTIKRIVLICVVFWPKPTATSSLRLRIVSCLERTREIIMPSTINGTMMRSCFQVVPIMPPAVHIDTSLDILK
ncbi:hypothetical protein D3C77_631510 [compost metagenome]